MNPREPRTVYTNVGATVPRSAPLAGLCPHGGAGSVCLVCEAGAHPGDDARRLAAAVAAERERCAAVADRWARERDADHARHNDQSGETSRAFAVAYDAGRADARCIARDIRALGGAGARERDELTVSLAELHAAAADIVGNGIEYGSTAAPRVHRLERAVWAADDVLRRTDAGRAQLTAEGARRARLLAVADREATRAIERERVRVDELRAVLLQILASDGGDGKFDAAMLLEARERAKRLLGDPDAAAYERAWREFRVVDLAAFDATGGERARPGGTGR